MSAIKKILLRLFFWSWIITLPLSLIGAYLTYQTWQRYQTFMVRYDPSPFQLSLSELGVYEIQRLRLKVQAAVARYTHPHTQLNAIYLYASKADLSRLDANLPHSGYQYIKAGLMQGDKLTKAKLRYRGDFLSHWGWDKKSFRVKTKKSHLYQGMRSFNLIAPKYPEQLNNYFAYQLAERLDLLTPKTRLIRLYLNNEDQGIYVLVEQLKELTLRSNKLMPADIYRGELIGKDAYTDSGYSHLFESPALWDKVAVNNHYPESHNKPLAHLLTLIQNQNNPEATIELGQILDLKAWARFSVFEALIQTWHYDSLHNWRLYYDPWQQKFVPIVWDPVGWKWLLKRGALYEIILTDLHQALFKNGEFLRLREQAMQDFFNRGEAEKFLDFVATNNRVLSFELNSDGNLYPPDRPQVKQAIDTLYHSVESVFDALKQQSQGINEPLFYSYQSNVLQMYLKDQRPLQSLRLVFDQKLSINPAISLEYQQHGSLISRDITEQLMHTPQQLILNVDLLPNLSIEASEFKFLGKRKTIENLILGNYKIQISDLPRKANLLAVWADYGQGWQLAKKLDDNQVTAISSNELTNNDAHLPYRDYIKPWTIAWNLGAGFNPQNSEVVYGALNTQGIWQYEARLAKSTTQLRVNLPTNTGLRISDVNLSFGIQNVKIATQNLIPHQMKNQGHFLQTIDADQPYFIVDIPAALQSDINKEIVPIALNFKVEQDLNWQQVFDKGLLPFHHDIDNPIPTPSPSEPLFWSGDIQIDGIKTITRPLVIAAGSRILFSEQATLIIKNRLLAIGAAEQPIQFLPLNETQAPWGAVVLIGDKANDSILNYCQFSKGSGLKSALFEYSGMLSIHAVQDVKVKHCSFSHNKRVDDMVHLVYSDVKFEYCKFNHAFADALDIDISKVSIDNSVFNNSGNDAIDLMTSEAVVANSNLFNNADKGISVGENSQLFAVNNQLVANNIAIQVKDHSTALLFNQSFTENKVALNTYKKNWRYGDGGLILASQCKFSNNAKTALADKHSQIYLFDSSLSSAISERGVQSWLVDDQDRTQAGADLLPVPLQHHPELNQALHQVSDEWIRQRNTERRGADSAH